MVESTVEKRLASAEGIVASAWSGRLLYWLGRVALYSLLAVLSFLFTLPFLWMLSSSLKTDPQVYVVPPILIPNPARWANYVEALTYLPFHVYFVNTTLRYAMPATVGTLVSSMLVAYGFSRIRWQGREVFFFVCIASMMIPFQVRMVPLFVVFRNMGWINTYLPLVVPSFFGSAYFIFMLRQFFMTIPQELSDAARIDGCSELGILYRIIMPLSKPALAVVALFEFMGCWNNYLGPLIYINQMSKYTIALGIAALRASVTSASSMQRLVWPYLMAASTAVTFPIILLFYLAQRTFIEGIALTGVKG